MSLNKLRQQLDQLDQQLLDILYQRLQLVKQVGNYKKQHNMTALQTNRWKQILDKKLKQGEKLGLSKDFIKDIWEIIHKESLSLQNEILKN